MQTQLIILVGLAVIVARAFKQAPGKIKPAWSPLLKGWQKVFGLVAFVMAVLIVMNPEFLALGLVGDAAFFDLMVLAISLQMHMLVVRAGGRCVTGLATAARWMRIPSPGLAYLLAVSTVAAGSVFAAIQKALHRFTS